jgi:hypothetical protein
MTHFEQTPETSDSYSNGIEFIPELQGREIALAAMRQDRILFDAESVPNLCVLEDQLSGESDPTIDSFEAWSRAAIDRFVQRLTNNQKPVLGEYISTGGPDWLDQRDDSFKLFGVLYKTPDSLATIEAQREIHTQSRHIDQRAVLPAAQSFTGAIVRFQDVIGQVTDVSATYGFALDRQGLPGALLVRAWLTMPPEAPIA